MRSNILTTLVGCAAAGAIFLAPTAGHAQVKPPGQLPNNAGSVKADDPANRSKSISRVHAGIRGGDLGGGLTFERRITGRGQFRISTETVTFFTASSPNEFVTIYRISGEQRARAAYRLIGSLELYAGLGAGVRYTTVTVNGTGRSLIATGVSVIVPAVAGATLTLGGVFELGVEGGMLYDVDNDLVDGIAVASAGARF